MIYGQVGDPASQIVPALAAVFALIGLFTAFMKMTGESNTRVDNITAAQIKQLADQARSAEVGERSAYEARDLAREEAERWRQRYEAERDQTAALRTELAVLRVRLGIESKE